jgi:hypothetical protein
MSNRWNFIRRNVSFVAAVAVILCTSLSYGTTLKKLSLEELVSSADTITVGKCEKTESVWLARKIYTVATIRVSQSVKGKVKSGSAIDVYVLGGQVKKPMPVKMQVPSAAKVTQGEEMVLFLRAAGPEKKHYCFVGMAQGKVPIQTNPKTGEKVLHYGELAKGVKLIERDGGTSNTGENNKSFKEGLEDFLHEVEQIMAAQTAKDQENGKDKNQFERSEKSQKGGVK